MKMAFLRTPIVNLKNSPFGSTPGIPANLPYLASVLLKAGHQIAIVDAYGLAPHRFTSYLDKFEARGLLPDEIVACIPGDVDVIGVSVHCTLEHGMAIRIIKESKLRFPDIPLVVGGYHTTFCVDPFLEAGADYLLQGEGEHRLPMLLRMLESGENFSMNGIFGSGFNKARTPEVCPIEDLPFAYFDPIPLDNYWKLHYAHGPVREGKYITMFTSRGCPFACAFCQTPKMWGGHWMAKSPSRIVDEMDYYHHRYGVSDFHIQDENFSLSKERTREFTRELIKRKRNYTYCFPSGIKVETVGEEELQMLYDSGCKYFALSPESASRKVLKLMNKPVDLDHVKKVVHWCNKIGIRVNCNFVLGFPGEEKEDRKLTYKFIRELIVLGMDEIVAFMLTPLPETDVADLKPDDIEFENINFSPTWRDNYKLITYARIWIYIQFAVIKTITHPVKVLRSIAALFTRRFSMKSDMTVYRFMADLWDRHVRKQRTVEIREVSWFSADKE
ncbi:MAG: B12-binding domain-containing radical SAM protein [Candidatus Sabulitectum sp.]|nr:B12-binding domain-containing radical SAM protein [Candidatus Sabulitectum sp.]